MTSGGAADPAGGAAWREGFLGRCKMLRLATVGPGGEPHVAPVWYMYEGGKVYVGTGSRTKKARNLRREGARAAFCVDVGEASPDIEGVSGAGAAALITEPGRVRDLASRILLRYYGSLEEPAAAELLAETDCVVEITPEPRLYARWRY